MIGTQSRIAGAALRFPAQTPPGLAIGCLAVVGATAVAWIAVRHPDWYRPLFAIVLAANLLIVATRWPRTAAVLTLLFLPFLALVRRLLIAEAGWSSYDPLLLVGPIVACALVLGLFLIERRQLARDPLSKLVYALLALSIFQIFNPLGPGVLAGFAGLLFLAAPLLWFLIGRELADRQTASTLIYGVIAVAIATSAYGLWQTEISLPKWDDSWVETSGYAALHVGETIRAFGTFSSSAEYAAYAGTGFVFAFAFLLHRRFFLAAAIPFLALAIFLASARGILVLTLFAAIVLLALRSRNPRQAPLVILVGLAILSSASVLFGPALDRVAARSSNPLVSHQIDGLLNPVDPKSSTLLAHWGLFKSGVEKGFTNPLGRGTGATNTADEKLGGPGGFRSEVDLSDTFVGLGLVGGLIFLAIVVITFRRITLLYLARRDPVALAVMGLLVVTIGQWLNGGHYALAPLTWFLIGWVTRESRVEEAAAPTGTP